MLASGVCASVSTVVGADEGAGIRVAFGFESYTSEEICITSNGLEKQGSGEHY